MMNYFVVLIFFYISILMKNKQIESFF